MSLADLFERLAAEHTDRVALEFEGAEYTYADLDARANRAARGLQRLGIGPGDRIAFLEKNGVEFFDVMVAASKIGAVCVPVNWRLTGPELARILEDCAARLVFVGTEFAPLADHPNQVVIGADYDSWLAEEDPGPLPADRPDDATYLQLYTSGTTGLPKGVMLGEGTADALTDLAHAIGYTRDSVLLMILPLFHTSYSIPFAAMCMGGRVVLHRDVDVPAALRAIPEHRITHGGFVPALLAAMCTVADESADFSSLELIMYGASPISETVLRNSLHTFGCRFAQLYGLTESGGTVAMLAPEDHDPDNRPGLLRSLGKPLPWVEMRIVDPEAGTDLEDGTVGELWIRTVQNMQGYWNKPAETAAALVEGGWLRSGDLGYRDVDGFVYLHDRLKDMIVSGAENVYPAEVENALMAAPGVADVAVIGVPHPKWGETVKAIVVPADGAAPTEAEIIAFAREQLTHYKCPTSVDFTAEPLPRNPSGKLLKRVIREPYWAGQDRRVT